MPAWIHQRAEHILAKHPAMPMAQAFALATLQSHGLGKTPKSYGTAEGRSQGREKYPTPKDDKKTANPGGLTSSKMAAAFTHGFGEELLKLAFASSEYSTPTGPNPPIRSDAGDQPAFKAPNLKTGIQKASDMMPDGYGFTYKPGDFKQVRFTKRGAAALTPMGRLAQSKAVGMPKMTPPPGPSIADIAKPKGPGFGTGIPGAYKSGIGGEVGTAQK
jgi:hypothetical protein